MWAGPMYYCLACNELVPVKEEKGRLICMKEVGKILYCNRFGEVKPDQGNLHDDCTREDHGIRPLMCGNVCL